MSSKIQKPTVVSVNKYFSVKYLIKTQWYDCTQKPIGFNLIQLREVFSVYSGKILSERFVKIHHESTSFIIFYELWNRPHTLTDSSSLHHVRQRTFNQKNSTEEFQISSVFAFFPVRNATKLRFLPKVFVSAINDWYESHRID